MLCRKKRKGNISFKALYFIIPMFYLKNTYYFSEYAKGMRFEGNVVVHSQ